MMECRFPTDNSGEYKHEKSYITCEHCRHIEWFYTHVPMECEDCNVPRSYNVLALKDNIAARKRFFGVDKK